MAFNVNARVENPGDTAISITISMSLNDWERLEKALFETPGSYPQWNVARAVRKVLSQIKGIVTETMEVPD